MSAVQNPSSLNSLIMSTAQMTRMRTTMTVCNLVWVVIKDLDDEDDEEESKDDEQDPYFTEMPQANEHDRYKEAQERLEKKYRTKVTKVITEWSELFERYNKMKAKDPQGTEKYRRFVVCTLASS